MPWPALNPGELRHQITVLHQVASTGASGSAMKWLPLLSTWAKIEPISGREQIDAGQTTTELKLTVSMNWQPGIRPDMQIQAINGTYVIESIQNPLELNVSLILTCLGLNANQ